MISISDNQCTGCTMCGQICPTHAISFETRNGFRFPEVDNKKCIECNLCEKRCPALNNVDFNTFPDAYSAWIKNEDQRVKCTSGGLCYEISHWILENGGYVCGVKWRDAYKNAEYTIIHSVDELPLITQTKYFQPEMNDIFIKVKELLEHQELVLFIGTSCSNAALLSFLGGKSDNLVCIDFICRGYTSQLYHQKRADELEKEYCSKLSFVQYKEKSKGWLKFGTRFEFNNGKSLYINRAEDPYEYMLQIDDYITRPSCFNCKYRKAERVTDITLGDFWGIKGVSNNDYQSGVSAVLVNSEKGKKIISAISEKICISPRSIWEIAKGNKCLLGQLKFKEGREEFYNDIKVMDIEDIHKKYGNIRKYKAMKMKIRLKRIIKTILQINIIDFVRYNFFSQRVVRDKGVFLIPYCGSRIRIDNEARLVLHGNLYLNSFKHKGSKEETFLHVFPKGKLEILGRVRVAAGSTIDILHEGEMNIGSSDTNYGTVIVCSNKIQIGDGVIMGRNVTIYDSNFHPTQFNKMIKGRPLVIGNHVWLCTGVCIAKGLTVGDGAICGINSLITRNVKERTSVLGNPAKCVMENVEW